VVFCHPTLDDLNSIKAIFQLFGKASGLQVNYTKSTATLLNCTSDDVARVPMSLGCRIAELLITYLGIPLTIRRPTHAQLQPLITKAANMLPTWKSKLMCFNELNNRNLIQPAETGDTTQLVVMR
jgi:hypothetical protein